MGRASTLGGAPPRPVPRVVVLVNRDHVRVVAGARSKGLVHLKRPARVVVGRRRVPPDEPVYCCWSDGPESLGRLALRTREPTRSKRLGRPAAISPQLRHPAKATASQSNFHPRAIGRNVIQMATISHIAEPIAPTVRVPRSTLMPSHLESKGTKSQVPRTRPGSLRRTEHLGQVGQDSDMHLHRRHCRPCRRQSTSREECQT
jgi:hypothetical protein